MFLRTAAALLAISTLGVNASYEKIAGYEPGSAVTDHNAVDLDQKAMEDALGNSNDDAYGIATNIYSMGGNSKSYAAISIVLTADVEKGTDIKGKDMDGNSVIGKAYATYKSGSGETMIKVQYPTSAVQDGHLKCKVGGLIGADQVKTGCLEESGELEIAGTMYPYTYDIEKDNKNGRTIQGFSTSAESKMYECNNGCPYTEYEKYFKYFGDHDYADKWIMAGLKKEKVTYSSGKSFDFTQYGFPGRKEVVKKGTVYLNFYMYIIRELYDAIGDCKQQCATCNDDSVHAWDEAVAYYTGSLEGQIGKDQSSKLLHELADKRCQNFKTCGAGGDMAVGQAMVNYEIFKLFNRGKKELAEGKCEVVEPIVDDIIALMSVPMVQGAQRYAWRVANEDTDMEKKNAEGLIFTMAILPRVADCDKDAADILLKNMQVTTTYEGVNFPVVKSTFESVYKCMGITCAQIGGLLSGDDGVYYTDAEPCVDAAFDTNTSPASIKTETVALVTALGAVAANFL